MKGISHSLVLFIAMLDIVPNGNDISYDALIVLKMVTLHLENSNYSKGVNKLLDLVKQYSNVELKLDV